MKTLLASAIGFVVAFNGAVAQAPPQTPTVYQELIRCRSISDEKSRLACFDLAAGQLEAATQKREIIVVDREQVKKTKRTLFGLTLPKLDLFDSDDDAGSDEIKSVDGIIASAGTNGDGRWTLQLQDGATWQQIDDRIVARPPKAGFRVVIKRAALGTFMMQIEGQNGIRVKRVR